VRMITGLSRAMRKLATWWVLAVTAGVFAVFAVAFFATSLPFSIANVTSLCGAPPPDVRFYTPADGITQFLTGCGEAGRAAYRDLQMADLFYPAVSGLFLASALAVVLVRISRPGSPVIALAALPLLGSSFDYLENIAAWSALTAFPGSAETATSLLGVASIAKQAVNWASWLLLLLAVGCLVTRVLRHRHQDSKGRQPSVTGPAAAPYPPSVTRSMVTTANRDRA
jgi:hypothetical protein